MKLSLNGLLTDTDNIRLTKHKLEAPFFHSCQLPKADVQGVVTLRVVKSLLTKVWKSHHLDYDDRLQWIKASLCHICWRCWCHRELATPKNQSR